MSKRRTFSWLVAELAAKTLVLAGDDSYTRCIEMELNAVRGLQNKDHKLDPLVKLFESTRMNRKRQVRAEGETSAEIFNFIAAYA